MSSAKSLAFSRNKSTPKAEAQFHQKASRVYATPKAQCDPSKWKSDDLIRKYNVSLVLTVDQRGCGKFNSIQKAIDAVPELSPSHTLIIVDSGTYREKVIVPESKKNIIIKGQGYLNTAIEWDDDVKKTGSAPSTASFAVLAPNFTAYNISFKNTAPPAFPGAKDMQAVALRVVGDQSAFYDCGMFSAQDTLLDESGRHFFKRCFIQGSVDFIFGSGRSLYQDCILNSIAESTGGLTGAITAQLRDSLKEQTGYSFVNCKIQGAGKIALGRAWGHFATVVFAKCSMSNIVDPKGWYTMDRTEGDTTMIFREYQNCGVGAAMPGNKDRQLGKVIENEEEVAPFLNSSYIDGNEWLKEDSSTRQDVCSRNSTP